ncbi:MAG: ImmA/IrrE family metallo-endopeptidase [Desulfobulbaceae bacterium]|nr:ImmA/IrrE family metallo-endopeptidase [Desulfobulbaceae bacterium]
MARRPDPFIKVRREAEELLRELEIDTLPIDPFMIARQLDIDLRPLPASVGGASGMLLHVGGRFGIMYPTHLDNEGFKNFSVGHEIGHYRLPSHPDAIFDDRGQHISHAGLGFSGMDRYEQEADHFAAALLMPTGLFTAAARHAGEGLNAIETLAGICKTSLESTAIRFVVTSRDPVALIRSQGKSIDYAFMSESLKDFSDLDWIRKRTPLPPESLTAEFNSDKGNVENAVRIDGASTLQEWFNGPHRQEIVEEVIGLGSYGKTLTVLTGMEPPDEQEDEEDWEELLTPRFRK